MSSKQFVINFTLQRQKRELDLKKAMLDRREEELRNSTHNSKFTTCFVVNTPWIKNHNLIFFFSSEK